MPVNQQGTGQCLSSAPRLPSKHKYKNNWFFRKSINQQGTGQCLSRFHSDHQRYTPKNNWFFRKSVSQQGTGQCLSRFHSDHQRHSLKITDFFENLSANKAQDNACQVYQGYHQEQPLTNNWSIKNQDIWLFPSKYPSNHQGTRLKIVQFFRKFVSHSPPPMGINTAQKNPVWTSSPLTSSHSGNWGSSTSRNKIATCFPLLGWVIT